MNKPQYRHLGVRWPRKGEFYMIGLEVFQATQDMEGLYKIVEPIDPPLRDYTFDMQLDGSITVKAASGAEALKAIQAAFEREALCRTNQRINGQTVMFRAKLAHRPEMTEPANVVTLKDWAAFNAKESGND